jgi:hypothetical protein
VRIRQAARLLISSLLVCFLSVQAEELAPENIQKFISTLSPLRVLAKDSDSGKLNDAFKTNTLENRFQKGFYTNLLQNLRTTDQKTLREIRNIVTSKGFSTSEEWAGIGDRVMAAYIAIALEKHSDQLKQAINLMHRKITQMQNVLLSSQQVPPSDISAVRPFVNHLQSVAPTQAE